MDTFQIIETVYGEGFRDDHRIVRRICHNPLYALRLRNDLRRHAERTGCDAFQNYSVRRTSDGRLIEFERDLQQDHHVVAYSWHTSKPGHDADDDPWMPW